MHQPMPIIVGAPRSGTTLLRLMLDAHPDLAIPPETGFLGEFAALEACTSKDAFLSFLVSTPQDAPAWSDFGLGIEEMRRELRLLEPFRSEVGLRAFYRLYAARFGKARWGDKTPSHVFAMRQIETRLPEAHFIHIIRDGRDVAQSWRKTWFSPGEEIATLARHWQTWVEAGRQGTKACRRAIEVRYERLVEDPAAQLRRICDFLDLRFDPAMLHYFKNASARLTEHGERQRKDGSLLVSREQRLAQQKSTLEPPMISRIGAWRRELTQADQQFFEDVAGPLLRELGYSVRHSPAIAS